MGAEKLPFVCRPQPDQSAPMWIWSEVARLYGAALRRIGLECVEITAPDVYQTRIARRLAGIGTSDIHLSVRPAEHLRPMFGLRNFFVYGSPFPELSAQPLRGHPAYNVVRTLRRADQVLCLSSYGTDSLLAHGVLATTLPPPVFDFVEPESVAIETVLCRRLRSQAADAEDLIPVKCVRKRYDRLFLAVMDIADPQMNVTPLLNAFAAYKRGTQEGESSALLLLSISNNATTPIREEADHTIPDIYHVPGPLSPVARSSLHRMCDFYVASTSASALNVPLIEAMANGVIPISSAATAMADIVSEANALVLATRPERVGPGNGPFGESIHLTHFPPTSEALVSAFAAAAELSPETRTRMATAAHAAVALRYNLARFASDFATLVNHG